jgi:hypothetical protein
MVIGFIFVQRIRRRKTEERWSPLEREVTGKRMDLDDVG